MFDRPTGVAIGANGDIFVSDGHSRNTSNSARIVKFTKDGKFIKTWGRMGSEPGNFREPHDLYVGGSKGWVYVADRQNNRVQVFDQDGNFIAAWKQFGQPSSVYVDKNDNIYIGATYESVAPGETALRPTAGPNDRAIVIGNAITGELKYLIPDPGDLSKMTDTGTSASGIAVDDQGNIYAADVGFQQSQEATPAHDVDIHGTGRQARAPINRRSLCASCWWLSGFWLWCFRCVTDSRAAAQEQAQVQRDAAGILSVILGPVNARWARR